MRFVTDLVLYKAELNGRGFSVGPCSGFQASAPHYDIEILSSVSAITVTSLVNPG